MQDSDPTRVDDARAAAGIDAAGPLPVAGAGTTLPTAERIRRRMIVAAITVGVFIGGAALCTIPTGSSEVQQEVKKPGVVSVGPVVTEPATRRTWGAPFTALEVQKSRDNATISIKGRGLLGNMVAAGLLFGFVGWLRRRRRTAS